MTRLLVLALMPICKYWGSAALPNKNLEPTTWKLNYYQPLTRATGMVKTLQVATTWLVNHSKQPNSIVGQSITVLEWKTRYYQVASFDFHSKAQFWINSANFSCVSSPFFLYQRCLAKETPFFLFAHNLERLQLKQCNVHAKWTRRQTIHYLIVFILF